VGTEIYGDVIPPCMHGPLGSAAVLRLRRNPKGLGIGACQVTSLCGGGVGGVVALWSRYR